MAGIVVTVAQQKGGAGKSTLAAHLAVAWAGQRRKVAVIDIDPQASLAVERALALGVPGGKAGLDFAQITGWRTAAEVERQAKSHDVVVIDSPPHAETEARLAVRAASLLLVPVQPSPMDVWATRPTLDLAKAEKVPVLLILNRVPPRANLTEAMSTKLAGLGVGVAETRVGNRVALATAMAEGRGITETEPSSRAGQEIAALAEEIISRAKR